MFGNINQQIDRIQSLLSRLVRVATVTSVLPNVGKVRVRIDDADHMVSYELPVIFAKTLKNKAYDMPDIGEQVLCVFLPNGPEQGFVLGSFYSTQDTPPVNSANKTHYCWPDGSWIEYDRSSHTLTANIQGDAKISATGGLTANIGGNLNAEAGGAISVESGAAVTIKGASIALEGPVTCSQTLSVKKAIAGQGITMSEGSISADRNITCRGSNPNHHDHDEG
ncbi:MAG: phage baseplate assembly protein V [Desulfobacteraceae bacterium]|nr:phage baseplate assembly protein V [Desulfobacteraceae bacterium]